MGRLVDVDDILSTAEGEFGKDDVDKIRWLLAHIGTAYDVEKVIAQLEFRKSYLSYKGLIVSIPVVTFENVMEIVKRGGVDKC